MTNDPYFIDFPGRIQSIQAEMAKDGVDVYLGSRLRTMSWTTDAFCPWRSFILIPADGLPTVFTLSSTRRASRMSPGWTLTTCSATPRWAGRIK